MKQHEMREARSSKVTEGPVTASNMVGGEGCIKSFGEGPQAENKMLTIEFKNIKVISDPDRAVSVKRQNWE